MLPLSQESPLSEQAGLTYTIYRIGLVLYHRREFVTYLILDVQYLRKRSAEEEGKSDRVELHGGSGEEWIFFKVVLLYVYVSICKQNA